MSTDTLVTTTAVSWTLSVIAQNSTCQCHFSNNDCRVPHGYLLVPGASPSLISRGCHPQTLPTSENCTSKINGLGGQAFYKVSRMWM